MVCQPSSLSSPTWARDFQIGQDVEVDWEFQQFHKSGVVTDFKEPHFILVKTDAGVCWCKPYELSVVHPDIISNPEKDFFGDFNA